MEAVREGKRGNVSLQNKGGGMYLFQPNSAKTKGGHAIRGLDDAGEEC